MTVPRLLLASTSPRRRALLSDAGIAFALATPGDEPTASGVPSELARDRARAKAAGAPVLCGEDGETQDVLVLGVDTVVDLDGAECGKARDAAHARELLRGLSGREHAVHTGHCVIRAADGARFEELATATVAFDALTEEHLGAFVGTEAWRGKAGAYGIQDPECGFARLLTGARDTVIGIHVAAVSRLLRVARGAP